MVGRDSVNENFFSLHEDVIDIIWTSIGFAVSSIRRIDRRPSPTKPSDRTS